MVSANYCRNCGRRVLPNEPFCTHCGSKTGNTGKDGQTVLVPPIHNIGFFDFDIDFSPYIEGNRENYNFEICSCGYLNSVDSEYCYMCGAKRFETKLEKILKHKSKPQFTIGNILCECGTVNSKDHIFCEMCGKQLRSSPNPFTDNYSNFNLEFTNSIFCFCGEENDEFSMFCKNCGRPLKNYGASADLSILCTCSTINEITSDFCIECGNSLKDESTVNICVCGHKNKKNYKFCEKCDRPLNPSRIIKSKIICSCGEVLDWQTDYCSNCGKYIKKTILRKNSINRTVKSIKGILR